MLTVAQYSSKSCLPPVFTGNQWVAGGATGVEQAVGRLVGALCVVSGKDEDAESAMLASWVSQVPLPYPFDISTLLIRVLKPGLC